MTVLKVGFWWVEGAVYSGHFLPKSQLTPAIWLFREPVALNSMPSYEGNTKIIKTERIDSNSKKIQTGSSQGNRL